MIKLIIFDLWHTLAERKNYYHRAIRKIEKAFNINKPHKEVVKIFENVVHTKMWEN